MIRRLVTAQLHYAKSRFLNAVTLLKMWQFRFPVLGYLISAFAGKFVSVLFGMNDKMTVKPSVVC